MARPGMRTRGESAAREHGRPAPDEAPERIPGEAEERDGEEERGTLDRLAGFYELRYSKLEPRKGRKTQGRPKQQKGAREKESLLQPGRSMKDVLAKIEPTYWDDVGKEYRRRIQSHRGKDGRFEQPQPGGPPPANNWIPIGPSVAARGQAATRPSVSGRAGGLAIASGGARVYAATADGGVWRSDNGGATWLFTMDSFDIDPTAFAVTSLACGAIAIDLADPDRVYVGSGEGDTDALFASRFTSALPSYRGVGPLRSDTGGGSWIQEPTAAGSPTLLGAAFFRLAVDPGDRENVVAATTAGLYRREPDGAGGWHWTVKRTGKHTSVVVARSGTTTTFYAAAASGQVYSSNDGSSWTAVGSGFPAGIARISLAVRPTDASVLYALNSNGTVYRLDGGGGTWRQVTGVPGSLAASTYALPIAVDPNNANVIYIGGQTVMSGGEWSGSIYRANVSSAGSGGSLTYSMTTTYVGGGTHADVHTLEHAPGDSSTLWAGCDGGVFRTTTATGAANFDSRNVGLGTLCTNYMAQHPSQPAVIFAGAQDNGTLRYTGEECWLHTVRNDGGYCIVNWNDPYRVLAYMNGSIMRATDGGQGYGSWSNLGAPFSWAFAMYQPLVGTPPSATAADADVVAYGGPAPYISTNFGTGWGSIPAGTSSDNLPNPVFAMAFASATRLFVATTGGEVYRYNKGASWSRSRIDNVGTNPLPLTGIVTDVAIDVADSSGESIYITFGGSGDYRHVWHYNGSGSGTPGWQARSGPSAGAITSLLDVEHNAIVVDPSTPATLFVGADVGVWRSTNSGNDWSPYEEGLPDAAVIDLQIHQSSRLLRAATHGRGVFERKLDTTTALGVEIYMRDTALDLARTGTVDYLNDPTQPGVQVRHWLSPNIKVDVPTPAGYQTPTNQIDFFQFVDQIVDGSEGVGTIDPTTGTVVNRVYVEVHNRGTQPASSVRIMALLANASIALPALPAGFDANVRSGTAISTASWQTVGTPTLANLRVGVPQVAAFSLPSTMLPPPASLTGNSHFCLLALAHVGVDDEFTATQTNVDLLTVGERKVAQKNLNIVAFVGTPPPPGPTPSAWMAVEIHGHPKLDDLVDVILDARGFGGQLWLLLPPELDPKTAGRRLEGFKIEDVKTVNGWIRKQTNQLLRYIEHGRYDPHACKRQLQALEWAKRGTLLAMTASGRLGEVPDLVLRGGSDHVLFIGVTPPRDAKIGARSEFALMRRSHGNEAIGGCTYHVEVVPRMGVDAYSR